MRPTPSLCNNLGFALQLNAQRSNPSGRQPVAGYFRFSMYVKSASKKPPNPIITIIVWKVSMAPLLSGGASPQVGCTWKIITQHLR